MVTPHRVHHELYNAPKYLTDPGDGETIRPREDLQICEMVSGASAETRTLEDPDRVGIRLLLRLLTDGGGDIIVYAADGFNVALEDRAAFAEESDFLSLISVSTATGFRWEILEGNVGVSVSA